MPKMFSVKGFAAGKNVTPSSGSAAAAIMASDIAVSIAAPKRVGSSVELQTIAIERPSKGGLIKGTASERIDSGWLQFPLWIKVPRTNLFLAASSRRYLLRLPR